MSFLFHRRTVVFNGSYDAVPVIVPMLYLWALQNSGLDLFLERSIKMAVLLAVLLQNTAAKLYCGECVAMGVYLKGCLPQHREHLQDNRTNAIAKRTRETTRRDAAQVCVHAIMHRSSQSQLCLSKCYTLKH